MWHMHFGISKQKTSNVAATKVGWQPTLYILQETGLCRSHTPGPTESEGALTTRTNSRHFSALRCRMLLPLMSRLPFPPNRFRRGRLGRDVHHAGRTHVESGAYPTKRNFSYFTHTCKIFFCNICVKFLTNLWKMNHTKYWFINSCNYEYL
jgi:hypothetical protein